MTGQRQHMWISTSFMFGSFAYEGKRLSSNQARLIGYLVKNFNMGWAPEITRRDLNALGLRTADSLVKRGVLTYVDLWHGGYYRLDVGELVSPFREL